MIRARLRSEVENEIGRRLSDAFGDTCGVLKHELVGTEPVRLSEKLMPAALKRLIVVRRHPVDADDGMPILQQAARQVKSDESRCASDENPHGAGLFGA